MNAVCRMTVCKYVIRWGVMISLCFFLPTLVLAHAKLLRAEPAVDSHFSHIPAEIRLWFSESLESRFSSITVYRAMPHPTTGVLQPQERVEVQVSPGPRVHRELAVGLPATLAPGLYLVQWKVLSVDSHRTTGSFALTYDPQAAPAKESPSPPPR